MWFIQIEGKEIEKKKKKTDINITVCLIVIIYVWQQWYLCPSHVYSYSYVTNFLKTY
jgi:hypothetical protein